MSTNAAQRREVQQQKPDVMRHETEQLTNDQAKQITDAERRCEEANEESLSRQGEGEKNEVSATVPALALMGRPFTGEPCGGQRADTRTGLRAESYKPETQVRWEEKSGIPFSNRTLHLACHSVNLFYQT